LAVKRDEGLILGGVSVVPRGGPKPAGVVPTTMLVAPPAWSSRLGGAGAAA